MAALCGLFEFLPDVAVFCHFFFKPLLHALVSSSEPPWMALHMHQEISNDESSG